MHPIFWRWITWNIYFFLSSAHSPLHHSIPYKFSHPCCPSQGIFPPPTVQTLVPFSGNNWPVGWSCCPTSLCYLLDVLSSGTLEPLSIRIWRSLYHGLCIVFNVFDDDDSHKRRQTSRPVVGSKVQTNGNFEAHIYIIVATIWILSLVSSLCALLDDRITFLYRLITIPLCLVISLASYTKIFRTLRYHQVQAEDPVQQQPSQLNLLNIAQYRKAVYGALWVKLALVVCFAPFFIVVTAIAHSKTHSSHLVILRGIIVVLVTLTRR